MNKNSKGLLIAYALFFALGTLLFFAFFCSLTPHPLAGLSVAFGPYATIVAKVFRVPNAGEFSSAGAALLLTIFLPATTAVSLRASNMGIRTLCAILTFLLIMAWIGYGALQIAACIV